MERRTVRLHSEDGRWLEMTVQGDRAIACVNGAEPFPFSFENLGFAAQGMGYQAWGTGGHFTVRHERAGVVVEFQGPGEKSFAASRLSLESFREKIDEMDALALSGGHASMI